jgi:hypothetical protein
VAPEQRSSQSVVDRIGTLVALLIGTAVIYGTAHAGLGFLSNLSFLTRFSGLFKNAEYVTLISMAFIFVAGVIVEIRDARKMRAGRRASAQVEEALKGHAAAQHVAEISTDQVVASLKEKAGGPSVADDQLKRLVEQRKQELLFDDDYFQKELSLLIVDYLQPLPRNAKRVLNRFRVNLLITYRRGMLVSEPKVTVQQIGKWLVLAERWPQLRRSLAATPDQMKKLEDLSELPPAMGGDVFMKLIKLLSPYYEGDEDLRNFIQSEPKLASVLERLSFSD